MWAFYFWTTQTLNRKINLLLQLLGDKMKTNLDFKFKTDKNLEKSGVWFKVADTEIKFLIRRFGGANEAEVKKAHAKYFAPKAKQIEANQLSDEEATELLIKTFVDVSLVDWSGVEIDGELAEFDKEKAVEIFKQYPELFQTIFEYAKDFQSYKEDLGNF